MFLGLATNDWIALGVSALIVIATIILGRLIVTIVLGRVARRLVGRTATTLDDSLLAAVRRPLYWLLVILALTIAVARIDFVPATWEPLIDDVFFVMFLFAGFAMAFSFISALFDWYQAKLASSAELELGEQLMPFFRRIIFIIVAITGLIFLLGHFEVEVSALVTTLGIGSLAIALAAQAALEDTISGFMIMIDRPFRIGDRIEILDLDTWGDVIDIGLRSSRVRTRDNRTVIVPNSVIGKSLIVNHSYPDTIYRIQIHVGVAYGSELEHVRETIINAVSQVGGLMPDKEVEALFLEFGESALIFRVRWWIESYVDTRRMFDSVNSAIYNALSEAGVVVPYPQRDITHRFDADSATRLAQAFGQRR